MQDFAKTPAAALLKLTTSLTYRPMLDEPQAVYASACLTLKIAACRQAMRLPLQDEEQNSRDQAPRRYEQRERGRTLIPVSEAVAEVLVGDEAVAEVLVGDEALCNSVETVQYICNPKPDAALAQQEQEEAQLTIGPIRDFVTKGPPEAHVGAKSFLLTTGNQSGTTTSSILQVRHGHIPGAVERFKTLQQLQEDAFKHVQMSSSDHADLEEGRKLREQYELITGLTCNDPLPKTRSEVPVCKVIADLAGQRRLYSGERRSQHMNGMQTAAINCCIPDICTTCAACP